MYHNILTFRCFFVKKCHLFAAAFSCFLLAFLGALALLIGNTAAGLASRLAGSLALAASAVLCAVAKVTSLDGLDMLHDGNLRKILI